MASTKQPKFTSSDKLACIVQTQFFKRFLSTPSSPMPNSLPALTIKTAFACQDTLK